MWIAYLHKLISSLSIGLEIDETFLTVQDCALKERRRSRREGSYYIVSERAWHELNLCFTSPKVGKVESSRGKLGDFCLRASPTILCWKATVILVRVSKWGILKSLISHVLSPKSWSNSFVTQWEYVILSWISLIQLFKFKTWETRLFKMPRLGLPRLQTRR